MNTSEKQCSIVINSMMEIQLSYLKVRSENVDIVVSVAILGDDVPSDKQPTFSQTAI